MRKILSISVAAYNAEKYLEKCLDSFCISEIIEKIEVLIINDGSTDRTAEIAAEYVSKYQDTFILINKENGGHGSTINTGIQKASGKYFKLVDADDWVEKDGMIQLVNILRQYDVDLVLSPYYFVNAENGDKTLTTCLERQENVQNQILDATQFDQSCQLAMHAMTYRTEILKNNYLPIDEKCFYVDLEYIVFYFRHVKSVYMSEIPVYDYLVNTGEQSVNIHNMVKRRDEHRTVCNKLLQIFSDPLSHQPVVQAFIEGCIMNHYRVLMSIEDKKQSAKELSDFDKELKKQKPDIYRAIVFHGIRGRKGTSVAILILRILRFHGYALFWHFFSVKK